MIFLLIPIVWLLLVAVFVAVCNAAARGDSAPTRLADARGHSFGAGLTVWDDRAAARLRERRHVSRVMRQPMHRRRMTAHGAR